MRRSAHAIVLSAVLAVSLWPLAAWAVEKVVQKGGCIGGPSTYRLVTRQIDADTLRIRVEIRNSIAGQEWSMFVSDNGDRLIRNVKFADANGFVRWVRPSTDRAGTDLIEMSAVNRSSGETCSDSIAFAEN